MRLIRLLLFFRFLIINNEKTGVCCRESSYRLRKTARLKNSQK